jgi:hypothetical protein
MTAGGASVLFMGRPGVSKTAKGRQDDRHMLLPVTNAEAVAHCRLAHLLK